MLRHLSLAALAVLAGCGSTASGPTAPATSDKLCTPSAVTCIGNATAKCAADGMAFKLNACADTQLCSAGVCAERKCSGPVCKDKTTLNECNPEGTAISPTPCPTGELCSAGACRPTKCTPKDKACGWRSVAVCKADGSGWDETKCKADEICTDGGCASQICKPTAVGCKDKTTAQVCKTEATGWTDALCTAGNECYPEYGVCLPTLTHPPVSEDASGPTDASAEDAAVEDAPVPLDKGPIPELEPVDQAVCTVDGQKIVFTSNKSANYVDKDKDLRITMDKGQIKIEISLAGLEELDVGHWTSAEAGDVQVHIYYNDGGELPAGAQFKYQSKDYDVELIKFQAAGGRVSGTFAGTFTGDGGDNTIPFENCSFDVKRHD